MQVDVETYSHSKSMSPGIRDISHDDVTVCDSAQVLLGIAIGILEGKISRALGAAEKQRRKRQTHSGVLV